MASEVVRDLADNMMGSNFPENTIDLNSSTIPIELVESQDAQEQPPVRTSISHVCFEDDISGNVDLWFIGDTNRSHGALQNDSRMETTTVPARPRSPSVDSVGFWYLAAMMLPLFSFRGFNGWRCSPSILLSTVELLLEQVLGFCSQTRARLLTLSRDDVAQDVFSGAMDIILVVYAIGFFLLTMYHASVFGRM